MATFWTINLIYDWHDEWSLRDRFLFVLMPIIMYPISVYCCYGIIKKKIIISKFRIQYYISNKLKFETTWPEVVKVKLNLDWLSFGWYIQEGSCYVDIFTKEKKMSLNGYVNFDDDQILRIVKMINHLKQFYYPHIEIIDQDKFLKRKRIVKAPPPSPDTSNERGVDAPPEPPFSNA